MVLTDPDRAAHQGSSYELTGPASLTQRDQVEQIGAAIGDEVGFAEITPEAYRDTLSQWGDEEMVDALVEHLRAADGRPAAFSSTVEALIGRPRRRLHSGRTITPTTSVEPRPWPVACRRITMTTPIDAEHERRRSYALVLLCVAQFVVVLDASIVNIALPTIGRELALSQREPPLGAQRYVLAFGGFLLLGGRLADLLGRRRLFVADLALFEIASLAAALLSRGEC